MKVLGITNQKGGVGKSTSALEIATCLGKLMKKRVLLIDTDQQMNLTEYTSSTGTTNNIFTVLTGDCPISEAIVKKEYLDIIPGSDSMSKADRTFTDNDDKYLLADVLDFVKDDYDYVIIDTAPSRNIVQSQVYVASDYLILPAECDEGSRMGIMAIESDMNKLKNSRDKACHAEILGYILTKYEKTLMHEIATDNLMELSESKESKPFVMYVHKAIKMSQIKTLHTTVTEFAGSSVPARDYYAICQEIVRRVEG